MIIKEDRIKISDQKEVFWKDVKRIRVINEKLALVLTNDKVIEVEGLRPDLIDEAFHSYERYLKEHPMKKHPV